MNESENELKYKQVYEKISKAFIEVQNELNALRCLLDMSREIDNEVEDLSGKIDNEMSNEVYSNFIKDAISINDELQNWIDLKIDDQVKGISVYEFMDYIDYIRDKESKEHAVELFKKLDDGSELEQYRNLYNLLEFLKNELEDDNKIPPEIVDYKMLELDIFSREAIISLEPSEIFYLDNNRKVDIQSHCLYVGLRDNLQEIPDEIFEEVYKNVLEQIANPYTKIGMGILYFSKLEDIISKNENYKPNVELVNKMMPYLAIKLFTDESIKTLSIDGDASATFSGLRNVTDGIDFINLYSQDFNIGQQLYDFLYSWAVDNNVELNDIEFIRNMSEQKFNSSAQYALNNMLNKFIEEERSSGLVDDASKLTDKLYFAMFLNSFKTTTYTLNKNIEQILGDIKGDVPTPENLFDIGSILFFMEDTNNPIPLKDDINLNKMMIKWMNVYTGGNNFSDLLKDFKELQQEVEISEDKEKQLKDDEVEGFIFKQEQDFYKEYIASSILVAIGKKSGEKLEEYSHKMPYFNLNALLDFNIINENSIKLLEMLDNDTKDWLEKLLSSNEHEGEFLTYTTILPYILSMDNIDNAMSAIKLLNKTATESVKSASRNAVELINFLTEELDDESARIDTRNLTLRKLFLLKSLNTLSDDILYMGDNEISMFNINSRSEEEIKDHAKYYALEELMEKSTHEQFQKEYEKAFSSIHTPEIREGLKVMKLYETDLHLDEDDYVPDSSEIKEILPSIILQSYMLEEMPLQFYQRGTFSNGVGSYFNDGVDMYTFANYINNYGMSANAYGILLEKVYKQNNAEVNNCLKQLEKMKGKGKNGEFYKEYINKYFGSFISEQRKNIYESTDEEQDTNKTKGFINPYIAMILETSQYTDDDMQNRVNEVANLVLNRKSISSEELFDLGTTMLYLEGSYGNKDKIGKYSKLLTIM